MIIITFISKNVITLLGFAFVDGVDPVSGAEDAHMISEFLIKHFQVLMICWNDGFFAIGGLVAQGKKQWFLIAFSGTDLTGNTTPKTLFP